MNRTSVLSLTPFLFVALASPSGVGAGSGGDRFEKLPKGWSVAASIVVPDQQLAAIGRKLGAQIVRLSNTTLTVDGQQLKVNVIDCKTDADAAKAHEALLRAHKDNDAQCPREGKLVIEFVAKDPRLIERAYAELGFKRPKVMYEVSFQAAPIKNCDYMAWNKMYNAFLAANPDEALIRALARRFTFGEEVRLRNQGLGNDKSSFTFDPKPRASKLEADGDVTAYSFANLSSIFGVPQVGVSATITSQAYAMTPSQRKAGPELLGPNEFWPSADANIVALAKQITEGKVSPRDKVEAILDWLKPGKNVRFDRKIIGSRFGVKKVIDQGYGMCWDFSDCFVTLCRASGVPSRQVLGWLHGVDGHVWAEALIEGQGWRQVDPTAGMGCDCRYVPFVATENGIMPMVYTSAVEIKRKR